MTTVVVADGDLVRKDPDNIVVYAFDWTNNLSGGAVIATSTLLPPTAIYPSTTDVALTVSDTAPLGLQADGKTVKVKLTGGTLGQRYRLTNRGVTNETPSQQKDKSIEVLCEQG